MTAPTGKVTFVGAGPGAPDLLTFRGAAAIAAADVVIWASSLVHPDLLAHARPDARIVDSAQLPLEDVVELYARAARDHSRVARIHSGDPSLWGAVQEQLDAARGLGLATEIVPGVSAFSAVAATAERELTIPEISQSVILTRLGGGTPMPTGGQLRDLARHGSTMAIFLSAARSGQLRQELLAGGYRPGTPVIVAYQATWPDQLVTTCTVDTLETMVKRHKLWKHTLFLPTAAVPDLPAPPALPERPDLREPDLPRTAKARPKALRAGWTTGTCVAAATKAATVALHDQRTQSRVEVALPDGRRISFAVEQCVVGPQEARAVVVKDAGDDPDVTHGAHMTATVTWSATPGVTLVAGEGVGTVTKPGLGIPVGEPSVTDVPRAMITQAATEVTDTQRRGLQVVISVPNGQQMARRTTNGRLGILGGISILGTTGIVRPFSTASWRASVEQAVSVLAAQGRRTMVLCTGGRTERGATRLLPDLPEVCFVEVGDFTGAAIRRALRVGVTGVVFVGMAGKLAKLAAGVLMTHYTRTTVDVELLGAITTAVGGSDELVADVRVANSGRHAYELWEHHGLLRRAGDLLCERVQEVLRRAGNGQLSAEVAMVDFTGQRVVGATRAEWVGAT
jgi:cobalt-precorrin-5B (C1)-methyltransferase